MADDGHTTPSGGDAGEARGLPENQRDATSHQHMSNQQEIRLPEGLDVETATDVLREYATTDDAQIINQSTLQDLKDEVAAAKDAFAALLAEESPQSADALSRQDMDALTEPFRDDEGDIDVDTLRQSPETGDANGGDANGGSGGPDDPTDIDALAHSKREKVERLNRKRSTFANRDMDGRVDALEAEIADTLGAESYEDVADQVEAL